MLNLLCRIYTYKTFLLEVPYNASFFTSHKLHVKLHLTLHFPSFVYYRNKKPEYICVNIVRVPAATRHKSRSNEIYNSA